MIWLVIREEEPREDAVAIVQDSNSENRRKEKDLRYILKVETAKFVNALDAQDERKGGTRMIPRILTWTTSWLLRQGRLRSKIGGKSGFPFWTVSLRSLLAIQGEMSGWQLGIDYGVGVWGPVGNSQHINGTSTLRSSQQKGGPAEETVCQRSYSW